METIFAGRHGLIIGGTGGIGAALAVKLAGAGASVTVQGGHSPERLRRTVDAIGAVSADCAECGEGRGFLYPVTGAGCGEAVAAITARVPAPDILVCAWGPFKRAALEDAGAEHWEEMVCANLLFPGMLVSAYLPGMRERGWGRILLFGGTNTDAVRGFISTAPYSAAKTGLGVLAKSVARSAGAQGVACNVICPGLTDTEYLDEAARAYNREKSPGGEALTPEEIAAAALEVLASPRLNGAVIPVDNGLVV
jgi:3-oxoacyl-[acyl-carrier protein] reductase